MNSLLQRLLLTLKNIIIMARKCLGILGAEGEPIKVNCFEPAEHEHNFTDIKTTSGGTTTTLTDALAAKQGKVVPTANGNFAALDTNGNLIDSTKKAGDFVLASSMSEKEDVSNKVTYATGWSQQLSDIKYPSEKLVKQSLNEKADFDSPHLTGEITLSGSIELKDDGETPAELKVPSFSDINDGTNTLQYTLDEKAALSHTHTTSNISDFTNSANTLIYDNSKAVFVSSDASSNKADIKPVNGIFCKYFMVKNTSNSAQTVDGLVYSSVQRWTIDIGKLNRAETLSSGDGVLIRCDYNFTTNKIFASIIEIYSL